MPMLDVKLYELGTSFLKVKCPHCGGLENTAIEVSGLWDCPTCGETFWISHARIVTMDEPTFTRAIVEIPDTVETLGSQLTNY